MNRRDFLKSAIALTSLVPLLPVRADWIPKAIQPSVASIGEWFVVLDSCDVDCIYTRGGLRETGTVVRYSGNKAAIGELARLLHSSSKGNLETLNIIQDTEEIRDEMGFTVGIIENDWTRMIARLRGIWHCEFGLVQRGETGLKRLPVS